jgi:aspartyl-tRNA(Asn)/glutamyl-tRNA(Gln) amidotransferase subunit B
MVEENAVQIKPLEDIVKDVLKEFPLKIEEYQNGKTGIVNMFMGEIKSRTQDKFEPRIANELLMRKLSEIVAS